MPGIKSFYYRLLNLGIDSDTSSEKILKIKILNGFALIAGIIMLIATGIIVYVTVMGTDVLINNPGKESFSESPGSVMKSGLFILFDFLSVVICALVLYLNHIRKYNIVILLLCIFSNIIVVHYFWFRGGLSVIYFFIPILIPVVFYDRKSWYLPFVFGTLAVMYCQTIILDRNDRLFTFAYPDTHRVFIFLMNFTITYLILFLIIYHFKKENLRNEMKLRKKNRILEVQADEIMLQRDELMRTKSEMEHKNINITDSINYAKNIQNALLPRHELLDEILPDHFILLRPRDIVSGDFYWFTYIENLSVIAAVDCTGHGVPGAFMSMLGSAFLNEIVNKEYMTHPGVILRRLRKEVIRSLHQEGETGQSKDGMDLAICVIDKEKMKLQFAGATNPLYLVRNRNESPPGNFDCFEYEKSILYEIKGDRMPVSAGYPMKNYTMHEIDYLEGDMIYLFSDGFADQFGGPLGKKFGYRNFKKLFAENSHLPLDEQKLTIENTFKTWKGDLSQIDDVLVLGVRL